MKNSQKLITGLSYIVSLEFAMICTKNSSYGARVWDLGAGDTFRGRTVATIRGVVGLAHNPVAIISFSEDDDHPARCAAAYTETLLHGDEVSMRARDWIRRHKLREGDAVDLQLLRSEVTATSTSSHSQTINCMNYPYQSSFTLADISA